MAADLGPSAPECMPLVHGSRGFPERYCQVAYATVGASQLAERVRVLPGLPGAPVTGQPERGLGRHRRSVAYETRVRNPVRNRCLWWGVGVPERPWVGWWAVPALRPGL